VATVLIADDSTAILEFCRQELTEEGYCVRTARNCSEAIADFAAHRPGLVILDINMPDGDGFGVLEAIRRLDPGVPIVLFTANDEACRRDPRRQAAAGCLGKSEDLTELKTLVARMIQRLQGPHGRYAGCQRAPGESRGQMAE